MRSSRFEQGPRWPDRSIISEATANAPLVGAHLAARTLPAAVLRLAFSLASVGCARGADRDWSSYLGGEDRSHYSTLSQITTANVHQLTPAWTYRAGELGTNPRSEMQCNPLVIDGVMYATLPGAKVIALDAATGRELWRFDAQQDAAQRKDARPKSEFVTNRNRGVTFWQRGDARRILHSAGHFLYALDPADGRPIPTFGDQGRIDFNEGLGRDPARMALHSSTTPGALFEDLFILSIRTNEGPQPSAPGHVRAFDVRTGKVVWTFRTIPHPGEFGHETWPPDA